MAGANEVLNVNGREVKQITAAGMVGTMTTTTKQSGGSGAGKYRKVGDLLNLTDDFHTSCLLFIQVISQLRNLASFAISHPLFAFIVQRA